LRRASHAHRRSGGVFRLRHPSSTHPTYSWPFASIRVPGVVGRDGRSSVVVDRALRSHRLSQAMTSALCPLPPARRRALMTRATPPRSAGSKRRRYSSSPIWWRRAPSATSGASLRTACESTARSAPSWCSICPYRPSILGQPSASSVTRGRGQPECGEPRWRSVGRSSVSWR